MAGMPRTTEAPRVGFDADRRRALLLSVTIHLAALLLLAVFLNVPKSQKLDTYLVIEVGTPAEAAQENQATTAEAPAKSSPTPQVASNETGEPAARSAPQTRAQAPEPQAATAQPEAPAQSAPATPTAPETAPQPTPAPAAPAQTSRAAAPNPPETPAQAQAPRRPPTPAAREPAAASAAESLPQTDTTATTLPEIDPVELQPRALAPSVTIPAPEAQAKVAQARALATTPQVSVAQPRAVPSPQASAQVAQPEALATPDATAEVSPPVALAAPAAQASAGRATTLAAPEATAAVAAPRSLQEPAASARVEQARPLQAPDAGAQVASATPLSQPGATASVAAPRALAAPSVSAVAGTARDVQVAPQIQVTAARSLPLPTVSAQLKAPTPAAGAPATDGAPPGNGDVATTRIVPRAPGGNAADAGQTGATQAAAVPGRGLATSPEGEGAGTGAPPPAARPYSEERERPVAVLVDNVGGYPQTGLKDASSIIEMPVEGGLTRLMLVFDRTDPGRVGPVRSARDYFVRISQAMNAVLVHDGGSPGAMAAIQRSELPTLNAFKHGDLFVRADARNAPYNLYSQGSSLRQAVNRLLPARTRVLSGTFFRPSQQAATVTSLTVRFGATYKTGFNYVQALDSYRWVRDGTGANDASGENVLVDAVLVGKILARPLPDDPEGRLYIPLEGGPASLYVRGRVVRGQWELGDQIRFVTDGGDAVDLSPFRTWIVLTPTYDQRVEQ